VSLQTLAEHRILDDGEFYVVLNADQAPETAAGFLQHRCVVSTSTPGGFQCIGAFTQQPDGLWEVKITKVYDHADETDCTVVAQGVARKDAIFALWKAKFDAFLGYHTLCPGTSRT
jgi:hypothetical protein